MIKEKLKLLPDLPGCYLMKDQENTIIYVGKAKNLKNRVRSYFVGSHNDKTTKLVSEIANFDFIITSSELEALVLELNLIKQHSPKYNIRLIDDKTYPYIHLTKELHPRLLVVRNKEKNGKTFGPYPNVLSARETVKLLNNIYPLRKCSSIPKKECLYYHMHQCLAPCIHKEPIDYSVYIEKIINFLKGNAKDILNELKDKMQYYSTNLEFERALEYRDMINHITQTLEKQKITLSDMQDRDIFGFYSDEEDISMHMFYMRQGKIVANNYTVFPYIQDVNEAIVNYLYQFYYEQNNILPKEILINHLVDCDLASKLLTIPILIPQKGDKRKLVELAQENAKNDLLNRRELYKNSVLKKLDALDHLAEMLNLKNLHHIEAFDNSNLFGTHPVSAMVCFRDGKPSKKEYRKYTIKTVETANDYASMKEVVYRRYFKLLMEESPMPNLIIMDGGKIQVNACLEVLNSLNLTIPVIGLRKDENHKTDAIIYQDCILDINKNSDVFILLANIQEEVHRFAISFFRKIKSKGIYLSRLDGIEGVGEKSKQKLLKHFKSIENIKNANPEEFKKIQINEKLAKKIIEHLKIETE